MGNRRNLVLDFGPDQPDIYLYTHWHADRMLGMVARALDEDRNRWGDDAYLARFLVTHIVGNASATFEETGWGLSPYPLGPDHPDIVVDLANQTVAHKGKTRTFEKFVTKYKEAL